MVCDGTIGPATDDRTAVSGDGLFKWLIVSSSHAVLTVWISPPLSLPELVAEVVVMRTIARATGPDGSPLTVKRTKMRSTGWFHSRRTVAVPKFVDWFVVLASV